MGRTIELTEEVREPRKRPRRSMRVYRQPVPKQRSTLRMLWWTLVVGTLIAVGALAGIGGFALGVTYGKLDPIMPGQSISAAQAMEIAENEQLRQIEEAKNYVKNPKLKAK